jgi:hypothetical protein
LGCCWQQPRAYTCHNSRETCHYRPSGNEEVNERAIGVYKVRNDLRLVELMHDSKALYTATVSSARWGCWQGPSADTEIKYLELASTLGLTWGHGRRNMLRGVYCQFNRRISRLSIRKFGFQRSYCEGGLNDANGLTGQRH